MITNLYFCISSNEDDHNNNWNVPILNLYLGVHYIVNICFAIRLLLFIVIYFFILIEGPYNYLIDETFDIYLYILDRFAINIYMLISLFEPN